MCTTCESIQRHFVFNSQLLQPHVSSLTQRNPIFGTENRQPLNLWSRSNSELDNESEELNMKTSESNQNRNQIRGVGLSAGPNQDGRSLISGGERRSTLCEEALCVLICSNQTFQLI